MQDQLIKNKAESTGFKTKSAFIRDRLLKDNLMVEKKISVVEDRVGRMYELLRNIYEENRRI